MLNWVEQQAVNHFGSLYVVENAPKLAFSSMQATVMHAF